MKLRSLVRLALGGMLVATGLPCPATAQVTAADSASVLLDAARKFESSDRWSVASAIYLSIVERFPDTPAAIQAGARLSSPPASALRSGSVELRVWMTTYGAWLGVAVPGAFGANSSEPYGVGLLLGGPTGFLAGRALANTLSLTEGQARAITFGGTWGTWQGFGWREVFDWGVERQCQVDFFGEYCYDLESSSEEALATAVVGGLAGIGVGALLSQRRLTAGTASAVNFASLWGTWFGVAGGTLLDLDGDKLLAATLVGGDAAVAAAALLAPRWGVTRSRARLVSISGVLGALAGGGIDLLAKPDDGKTAIAIPLAGSVLGLAVGIAATREDRVETASRTLDAPAGALVQMKDGTLALGTPTLTPILVTVPGTPRPTHRPGLAIEIFRAEF